MRLTSLISLTLLMVACGPKDAETGGASESASSSATTTPETTGDPTTGSGSTGGEPAQCQDPSLAEVGPVVTIALQNAGDGPIWLDARQFCGTVDPFDILGPDQQKLNVHLGLCEFTCAEALSGECGCQAGCGEPDLVIQLDPGATFETTWIGGHWGETAVPSECVDGCDATCVALEQAPPGIYTFVARSSGAVADCEGPCSCEANPDGWCQMAGARLGDELVVEATLDFPKQTDVLIVFP